MTILGPDIPKYPIGVSDFADLRRDGYTYVDKTRLVSEVLDAPGQTKLIPRPRRFGKTLNMSMLRYFFERSDEDRTDLFADTWIWGAEDGRFREHFGRYPVVSMTFKRIKPHKWDDAWNLIRRQIQNEVQRVWDAHALGERFGKDARTLRRYEQLSTDTATTSDLADGLLDVSRWLQAATGERVVVLIDEYDAVLHAASQYGYWDDAIAFFGDFLSGGFKDATPLYRGVLTGILKAATANIFSGLNNVAPYSLFHPRMASDFVFTETDVTELARMASRSDELETIRTWFNGYRFGGTSPETLYNPWSVLMCLSTPGPGGFQPHWKNSSSNALVRDLLVRHARSAGPDVTSLLAGKTITKTIDENVVLSDLGSSTDALWSLLAFSGYLTAESAAPSADGYDVTLRIPNKEVESVFRATFSDLLRQAAGSETLSGLTKALLAGDAAVVEDALGELLVGMLSFHDLAGNPVEAVYQAFILGMLVELEVTHRVTSNREAGYGRADVLVTPRDAGGRGAVLELKSVTRRETPESALDRALEQLRDRDYAAEVRAAGATDVHQYAVVFDGKRCWVRMVE